MKSTTIQLLFFAFLLVMAQSASLPSLDRTNKKSVLDCQACEYVMKFIHFQTLNQTQTVNAIKEKVKVLFKIIPSSAQNDEYFVNLEMYLRMMQKGITPQSICIAMMKCSSKQLDLPRINSCQVCTAVVDLIKFELTVSNATIQIIIKAVEALCAILGDVPVYQECKLILKDINQIIQWIEQQLTPTDICIRLGFCNKTANELLTRHTTTQLHLPNSSTMLYDLCKMAVSALDALMKNMKNKLDDLKDGLDDIWNDLGIGFADKYKSVVDMVVDELKEKVESIEGKLDPTKTCQALCLLSPKV